MTQQQNKHLDMLGAFAAGGLIDAGIALLLAPKSGRETRRSIKRFGKMAQKEALYYQSEIQDKMDRIFRNLQEDLRSSLDEGKNWTEDKISKIENALQAGRRKIETELGRILRG